MWKKISVLSCLPLCVCMNLAHGASVVTADHKGGYSALVMDEVLQYWTAQGQQDKPTRILLEISGDGSLESCRVLSSSGSEKADEMACESAQKASPFVAHPHNIPSDVYMSFWTGEAKAAKKEGKSTSAQDEKAVEEKPLQAQVVEKSLEDAQEQTPKAASESSDTKNTAANKEKADRKAVESSEKSESASTPEISAPVVKNTRIHAGIDYSRPRPTPAGLLPLGDLSGAKLPPSKETLPDELKKSPKTGASTTQKGKEVSVKETPSEKTHKKDASPKASPEKASGKPTEEGKEKPLSAEQAHEEKSSEAKPAPYAKGKEPFIQENRRGQVMDEVDYYVEKVIRKVRPVVEFPLGLRPGIVSASVVMKIQANGTITDVYLSSSSRNKALDEALVAATKKVSGLTAHPTGKPQELYLIYMVETPKP